MPHKEKVFYKQQKGRSCMMGSSCGGAQRMTTVVVKLGIF